MIGTFIVLKTLIFRYLNFYDIHKKNCKKSNKMYNYNKNKSHKIKKTITILFINFLQLLLPQTKINK